MYKRGLWKSTVSMRDVLRQMGEQRRGGGKEGRRTCDELAMPKASVRILYNGTAAHTQCNYQARPPHGRDREVLEGIGHAGPAYRRIGGPPADPAEPPAGPQAGSNGLITCR